MLSKSCIFLNFGFVLDQWERGDHLASTLSVTYSKYVAALDKISIGGGHYDTIKDTCYR